MIFIILFFLGSMVLSAQTTVPEWREHTQLPVALTGHGAVLLHNGDILIAGGLTTGGQASDASFVYSAATGAFTPTLNRLVEARAYHALVVVPVAGSSRVFAIGGYTGSTGNYRSIASVEVLEFDVAQQNWRWRSIGSLSEARGDCAAAWDGANFVIVSGGRVQTNGGLHTGVPSTVTDRIGVQTLLTGSIGAMQTARSEHSLVRILDQNNNLQVITAGGEVSAPVTATELLPLAATAWDPRANPPVMWRSSSTAVGDIAGIGRVFGGLNEAGIPLNTCEWYDVKSGWRAAPRMQSPRARARMTLIAGTDDTTAAYLIVAGQGTNSVLRATEIFQLPDNIAPAGQWIPFPPLNRQGAERTVTVAGTNLPLVTGGDETGAMPYTEVFQPLRANDVTFGQEEVGRTSDSLPVIIKNEWLLPVEVQRFRFAGSAEFILSGDTASMTIPAGGQRVVYVRFRPNAAGERAGKLLFDVGALTDTVLLRGRGIESEIVVVTETVAFDSVFVKTTERECFTAIRNRGQDTTVIDSIVVSPVGVYRVVSPQGRVKVAPGDSLVVCVEFEPEVRGVVVASLTLHIAARSFPLALTGTGIRRFATATASAACDTVAIAPGDSLIRLVTLFNPGDKSVTISTVNFVASVNGLFELNDPTILPLILLPGETVPVEVKFKPQREATERVAVDFVSDGDTAVIAQLCFVLRSRFLMPSVGSIDFGSVCVGDTVTRSLIFENPGQFENVLVQTVAMSQPTGLFLVRSAVDTTLPPRGYMQVTVSFVPVAAGVETGTLTASGSFGNVSVSVSGRGLPNVQFTPRSVIGIPAETVVIPVEANGLGVASLPGVRLTAAFNRTLLFPRKIVVLGGAPLPDATSQVTVTQPGTALINVQWQTPLVGDGPAFGIECEVLRGDNEQTPLTLNGADNPDFCITPATATIFIEGPCGGQGGFIHTAQASFVQTLPNPATDVVQVLATTKLEGSLQVQIVNSFGEIVAGQNLGFHTGGSQRADISVGRLPAGVYFIRAILDSTIIDVQPVTIVR